MSKTKEELNALKKEVEAVNEKLQELTEEELEQVNGGAFQGPSLIIGYAPCEKPWKDTSGDLLLKDIASRAAKERCDKECGIN